MSLGSIHTGKTKIPFFSVNVGLSDNGACVLKDFSGNTLTVGSTDQVVITKVKLINEHSATDLIGLQTSGDVVFMQGTFAAGIGEVFDFIADPIQLPAGVTLKAHDGTAMGINVYGYLLR